ncbi:hypothetical protein [uncultured Campylobacter sp.]|nr:hypothetical protein [uncultured Campylobacter sp.]
MQTAGKIGLWFCALKFSEPRTAPLNLAAFARLVNLIASAKPCKF